MRPAVDDKLRQQLSIIALQCGWLFQTFSSQRFDWFQFFQHVIDDSLIDDPVMLLWEFHSSYPTVLLVASSNIDVESITVGRFQYFKSHAVCQSWQRRCSQVGSFQLPKQNIKIKILIGSSDLFFSFSFFYLFLTMLPCEGAKQNFAH